MMAGVTNVLDSDLETDTGVSKGLKGSADSYADDLLNDPRLFFVHFFAWDKDKDGECDGLDGVPSALDTCSVIPDELLPPDEGDPALKDVFILGVRNYVAVGTARGPDPAKLITPRVFTFSKP